MHSIGEKIWAGNWLSQEIEIEIDPSNKHPGNRRAERAGKIGIVGGDDPPGGKNPRRGAPQKILTLDCWKSIKNWNKIDFHLYFPKILVRILN